MRLPLALWGWEGNESASMAQLPHDKKNKNKKTRIMAQANKNTGGFWLFLRGADLRYLVRVEP